jgi:hypothetical protein
MKHLSQQAKIKKKILCSINLVFFTYSHKKSFPAGVSNCHFSPLLFQFLHPRCFQIRPWYAGVYLLYRLHGSLCDNYPNICAILWQAAGYPGDVTSVLKRCLSCYLGLPIFETRFNVNSRRLKLKSGVLGPLPWWAVLGQVNCPKYVLLWHYSRLAGFLNRYFGPSTGPQVVTVPPIFSTPHQPNSWCVSVNVSTKERVKTYFDVQTSVYCKSKLILTFICPCIANISLKYNQQDTFSRSIYFYKFSYMFQAVPPPIIRSTKLCIERQVLSNQYCCLLLSLMRWNAVPSHPW